MLWPSPWELRAHATDILMKEEKVDEVCLFFFSFFFFFWYTTFLNCLEKKTDFAFQRLFWGSKCFF